MDLALCFGFDANMWLNINVLSEHYCDIKPIDTFNPIGLSMYRVYAEGFANSRCAFHVIYAMAYSLQPVRVHHLEPILNFLNDTFLPDIYKRQA